MSYRSKIVTILAFFILCAGAIVTVSGLRPFAKGWAPIEALLSTNGEDAAGLIQRGTAFGELRAWAALSRLQRSQREVAARGLARGLVSDEPKVREACERALAQPLAGERHFVWLGLWSARTARLMAGDTQRLEAYAKERFAEDRAGIAAELRRSKTPSAWLEALTMADEGAAMLYELARKGEEPLKGLALAVVKRLQVAPPEATAAAARVASVCTYGMGLEPCLKAYEERKDVEILAPVAVYVCAVCRNEHRLCDELRALEAANKSASRCDALQEAPPPRAAQDDTCQDPDGRPDRTAACEALVRALKGRRPGATARGTSSSRAALQLVVRFPAASYAEAATELDELRRAAGVARVRDRGSRRVAEGRVEALAEITFD